MDTKQEIREKMRRIRGGMEPAEWREKTELITQKVITNDAFREATDVYCYVDFDGEVGTDLIMEEAWRLGKNVWAPKVLGDKMEFFPLHTLEDLKKGVFGIPEPEKTRKKARETDALVIVPGIAFGKDRYRVGYGKGYYDKYLAAHPGLLTMGIAFDIQVMEQIPAEEFDHRLDILLTETLTITEEGQTI